MKRILLAVLLVLPLQAFSDNSAFKAQTITPSEEKHIIQMAKSIKTADGSTVYDVLQYVQRVRKNEFTVGDFELDYNSDGSVNGVSVGYWIGKKRAANDAYADLGWTLTEDHHSFKSQQQVSPQLSKAELAVTTQSYLMRGRKDFLRYIDELYKNS